MRKRVRDQRPRSVRSSLYQCERCGKSEQVPGDVLAYFDQIDPDDTGSPATFQCQSCPGIMYPDWWFRAQRATP
jgi:hypothetical protein